MKIYAIRDSEKIQATNLSFVDKIKKQQLFIFCSFFLHVLIIGLISSNITLDNNHTITGKVQSPIINAVFFSKEHLLAMTTKNERGVVHDQLGLGAKSLQDTVEEQLPLTTVVSDSIDTQDSKRKKDNLVFQNQLAALDRLIHKQDGTIQSHKAQETTDAFSLDGFTESTLTADIFDTPKRYSRHHEYETDLKQKLVIDPLIVYQRKIAKTLQGAMRLDENMKGDECVIEINLSRDGMVLSIDIIKGDNSLCDEASRATIRAGKLPMPSDKSLYAYLHSLQIRISPNMTSNVTI